MANHTRFGDWYLILPTLSNALGCALSWPIGQQLTCIVAYADAKFIRIHQIDIGHLISNVEAIWIVVQFRNYNRALVAGKEVHSHGKESWHGWGHSHTIRGQHLDLGTFGNDDLKG